MIRVLASRRSPPLIHPVIDAFEHSWVNCLRAVAGVRYRIHSTGAGANGSLSRTAASGGAGARPGAAIGGRTAAEPLSRAAPLPARDWAARLARPLRPG